MGVELLAGDAGLHRAVQVFGVDLQNLVHLHHVDRHAALDGDDMAFERGAGAERHDRHLVISADLDHLGDLFGRADEGDAVGVAVGVVGFVLAVVGADRRRGREPVAEECGQGLESRGEIFRPGGPIGRIVHGIPL